MDLSGEYEALTEFTRGLYRLWYIITPASVIQKRVFCHEDVIDKFSLTAHDFMDILQEESVHGFRLRKSSGRLLLVSQKLILICDSSVCYVSYDNNLSQRFQDFINTAKAWMSDVLCPHYNLLAVRAALRLIYEDIQDQVQKLKSDVEGCSWYSSRDLADLGKKGILLSSKSKKIMDEIFSPQDGRIKAVAQDGRVKAVAYLGTHQLQECKKPWDSIHGQLDGIRASLNAKLLFLNSRLVWIPVFYAFVLIAANLVATIRLSFHRDRSFFAPVLFASIVCLLFVYIHFFVARFATRLIWVLG